MLARKTLIGFVFLAVASGFAFRQGERRAAADPVACVKADCKVVWGWWSSSTTDANKFVDTDFPQGCFAYHLEGTTKDDAAGENQDPSAQQYIYAKMPDNPVYDEYPGPVKVDLIVFGAHDQYCKNDKDNKMLTPQTVTPSGRGKKWIGRRTKMWCYPKEESGG